MVLRLLLPETAAELMLLSPAFELPVAGSFCCFLPRPPAKQSMEKERMVGCSTGEEREEERKINT